MLAKSSSLSTPREAYLSIPFSGTVRSLSPSSAAACPVLPQFFRHFIPNPTQKLRHHRHQAQNLLAPLFFPFRITRNSPPDSGPLKATATSFLALGPLGQMGLSTMIRAVLPLALTPTSRLYGKVFMGADVESQRNIARMEASNPQRTDF